MTPIRALLPLLALGAVLTGCGGGAEVPGPGLPTASPAPTEPSSEAPVTSAPTAAPCDDTELLSTVAASVTAARLSPVTGWSSDLTANPFATRTTTGEEYARRLGFDCGLLAGEELGVGEQRLLIAAWTGPRMAWVVQSTQQPTTAYAPEATVTVSVGDTEGEWLAPSRTVWAGTLASGETFVVGHVDFNLGAAAKGWVAGDAGPDDGPDDAGLLAAERHGIAALEAAGMRQVDLAEPAEVGSEEGHLQFVSPTGQISVADVAPAGWFDPMAPRYYDGPTRTETIDGVRVRITEPGPDAPAYDIAAEIGFACNAFVWLLQPPGNGDAEELLRSAAAILATDSCRQGG